MGFIVKAVKSVVKAVVGVASKIVNTIVGPIVGLFKPKKAAKASSNLRLSKSLEPEAYRKIVFGRTAAGLDLRFWQVWGAKGTNYDEVLANATHRINAFKELYFEDELAIDANGNVMPAWAGVVSREVRRGIPGEAGMYAGGGGLWNPVSAPFTGVAHMKLAWVPTDAKLPNGVPSRYTQIVEGALVYDPRRDSTVPGGAGPHRINDQSTWEYAALDAYGQPIGRNNALQVLWYLLGWRITNPTTGEPILVAGRGVDPTDINLATFINAANDAEAAGYYTDLILSTEDSHTSNEDKLTAGGLIGQLIDTGGLWSYHANVDDTAEIAVELTDADVIQGGTITWNEYRPISDQYQQVSGKFVDPSPNALFQLNGYPPVRDANYENLTGLKRRKTQDFEVVQDVLLAQKLARLLLNMGQYQAEFAAPFMYRALRAQAWSIVRYTSERFGWVKLFRVYRHDLGVTGIEMLLREVHPSIWSAGSVTQPVAPGAGVKYDPRQEIVLANLNVALTTVAAEGLNGDVADALQVTWDTPPGNVRRTETRYRVIGNQSWETGTPVEGDAAGVVLAPVMKATRYEVQARHISVHEVPGPWVGLAGYVTSGSAGNVNYKGIIEAGVTAQWPYVGDPVGTRPEDNATVGAPTGTNVAGVPAQTIVGNISGNAAAIANQGLTLNQIIIDVNDLQDIYGDTTSAANSAAAAAASFSAAEQAKNLAIAAKDASHAAFEASERAKNDALTAASNSASSSSAALTAKQQSEAASNIAADAREAALSYRNQASGFAGDARNWADASAGSATSAGASANSALQRAQAADASAIAADTAKGGAEASRQAAALSESSAAGSASSAAASQSLSARASDIAAERARRNLIAQSNFEKGINYDWSSGVVITEGMGNGFLYALKTEARDTLTSFVKLNGARDLRVSALMTGYYGTAQTRIGAFVRVSSGVVQYHSISGPPIGGGGWYNINGILNTPADTIEVAGWVQNDGAPDANPVGSDGLYKDARFTNFILEDITETFRAAISASASATSASNAAASQTAAEQAASASNSFKLAAETAKGGAEAAQQSAVQSASNSAGSASLAQQQAGIAAQAQGNAVDAASQSAGYRDQSYNYSNAASGSASNASASATAAQQQAEAANASAIAANTARGGAEAAQQSAVQSKNDAAGSASSAATQASLSASASTAAKRAIGANQPPSNFNDEEAFWFHYGDVQAPLYYDFNGVHRLAFTTTSWGGVANRYPLAVKAGDRVRAEFAAHLESASEPNGYGEIVFFTRSGEGQGENAFYYPPTGNNGAQLVTQYQPVGFYGELTVPDGVTALYVMHRAWRIGGNPRIYTFLSASIRNITAEAAAANSATAAATSASQAAASQNASGQNANAAEQSKVAAQTAKGAAEAARDQSAQSASNSAGSASAAASSQSLAAQAQGNAVDAASQSAGYRDQSYGYANASSQSASAAAASQSAAGQSATAAEQSKLAAETARGGAELARNQAVSSANDAAGSSSAAAASQLLTANAVRVAGTHASGNLCGQSECEDGINRVWGGGVTVIPEGIGGGFSKVFRSQVRDAIADYVSGSFANRKFRVSARICTYYTNLSVGIGCFAYGVGTVDFPSFRVQPPGQGGWEDRSGIIEMPAGTIGIRAWVGQEDSPPNAIRDVRWSNFVVEDVTELLAAQASASAAAQSASTAQAAQTASGQSASAADTSRVQAQTAQGNAEAAASQSAASASGSAGSAAQAAASSTLSATYGASSNNIIPDTDFASGQAYTWYGYQEGFNGQLTHKIGTNKYWSGNVNALEMEQVGEAQGVASWYCENIPCLPDRWYMGNFRVAAHRCNVYLVMNFFDAAGNNVGGAASETISWGGGAGNGGIADMYRLFAKGKSPSNARFVRLEVLRTGTFAGQGGSWVWMLQPQISEIRAEVTTPPPFVHGNGRGAAVSALATVASNSAAIATLQGRALAYWQQVAGVNVGNGAAAFVELRAEGSYGAGATSTVAMGAREIHLYNQGATGTYSKALSVVTGRVTVYGDLDVGGAMRIGTRRIPIALQSFLVQGSDGQAVSFGADLTNIPKIEPQTGNLPALPSGQSYDIKALSLTSTGFTTRAKVITQGQSSAQNSGAGVATGSSPIYKAHKPSAGDAVDGNYTFSVNGNIQMYVYGGHQQQVIDQDGGGYANLQADCYVKRNGNWQYIGSLSTSISSYGGGSSGMQTFYYYMSGALYCADTIGQDGGGDYEFGMDVYTDNGNIQSVNFSGVTYQAQGQQSGESPVSQAISFRVLPQNA